MVGEEVDVQTTISRMANTVFVYLQPVWQTIDLLCSATDPSFGWRPTASSLGRPSYTWATGQHRPQPSGTYPTQTEQGCALVSHNFLRRPPCFERLIRSPFS